MTRIKHWHTFTLLAGLLAWNGTAAAQVATMPDTAGICTGFEKTFNVLTNDSGDELELTAILIGPAFGSATFTPDGNITLFYADGEEFDPTDAIIYAAQDTSGEIGIGYFTILVMNGDDCVWPGDANNDALVNNADVLPLGLFFEDNGPVRPDLSVEWTAQYSIDWEYPSLLEITDRKHADTNGDGVINNDDLSPIYDNYGEEHAKGTAMEGGDGFPPLGIDFYADTIFSGAEVNIPLYLGTEDIPASNIYGLAFTLYFDNDLIVPGSMSVTFNTGWLSSDTGMLISFNREDHPNGLFDVAVSRTNKTSATGYGHIGTVSFVMEDNLAGKITGGTTMVFNMCPDDPTISNALGGYSYAEALDLTCDSVLVLDLTASVANLNSRGWSVYPNPVTTNLFIQTENSPGITYQIFDPSGRMLQAGPVIHDKQPILLSDIAPGTYLLMLTDAEGMQYTQTIIKIND